MYSIYIYTLYRSGEAPAGARRAAGRWARDTPTTTTTNNNTNNTENDTNN